MGKWRWTVPVAIPDDRPWPCAPTGFRYSAPRTRSGLRINLGSGVTAYKDLACCGLRCRGRADRPRSRPIGDHGRADTVTDEIVFTSTESQHTQEDHLRPSGGRVRPAAVATPADQESVALRSLWEISGRVHLSACAPVLLFLSEG